MFRLAVADPESGVISINVSALARHRFGTTLHASLEAFVHGTPIDYLHQLSRMDDSDERAFNLVYYSTLLHELRHFFDFLTTPYGAFTLRTSLTNYQLILGLMGRGEPIIIPFTLGSDPFVATHELGLVDFANSSSDVVGRLIRGQQQIFADDRKGFRHEKGRVVQFGGTAMLEALAFNFQRSFLNFPTLRTPNLEKMFPAAFSNYDGDNPTNVDVVYRWFAPFQHMIGTAQNEAVAKILEIIIFASLCGHYRSRGVHVTRDLDELRASVHALGPELPSAMFQTLLAKAINQFDGKRFDRDTTWDGAWELIDEIFRGEYGCSIVDSIAFDIGRDETLAAAMPDRVPEYEHAMEHMFIWYRSLTAMRRRTFERIRARPANLVDPLTALKLFGPELAAPIEMVYPHSTNVVFPGSEPTDFDTMPLPREIRDMVHVAAPTGAVEGAADGHLDKSMLHERVYYASMIFKGGDTQLSKQDRDSWRAMSAFLRPFLKTVLYSHDPHVVVGRASKMIIDSLARSKLRVYFAGQRNRIFEAEQPDAYFDFYQVEACGCDLCSKSETYTRENLRSVSSLTLRSTNRFQAFLSAEKDTLRAHLLLRDWSEYRLCRRCFAEYFPERVWS